MKANQVLLDMLGDIQHSDDLEIQFAQLVPLFIENLGNPKVSQECDDPLGDCAQVDSQVHCYICQDLEKARVRAIAPRAHRAREPAD